MREKMASGGSRPFLFQMLLTLTLLLTPVSALAVGDGQIGPNAAIQAFKLKFGYTNEAAYITARTAAYRTAGVALAAVADGEFFYRQSDNTFRCYDGTAPYNAANWGACAAGGGGVGTLDAAYQTGRTINRTAATGSVLVQDGTNDAQPSLNMTRTAGNGAVLQITNAGTGPDLLGSDWNVTTAGVATFGGVKIPDDKDISLGTSDDAKFQWDTALTPDGVLLDMAVDSPLAICTDGAGCDLFLYSGAVGDLIQFDSSGKKLIFTDTTIAMGESDAVTFGASSVWSVSGTDAGPLKIASTAPGSDIWFGVDGAGTNLYLFGDTASAQVLWSQTEDALTVKGGASLWLQDSVELAFGTAASKVGDLSMSYSGATNILGIERPGAGAVGGIATETGISIILGSTDVAVAADGILFTPTASQLAIDGSDANDEILLGSGEPIGLTWTGGGGTVAFDENTNEVTFDGATLQLNDNDELYFGDGAVGAGDVSLAWDGTSLVYLPVAAGDVEVDFGITTGSANNVDVKFNGTTSGDGWFWDGDSETMTMTDAQFVVGTGSSTEDVMTFGGAKKIDVYHDATSLFFASDGLETTSIQIGNGVSDTDLYWNPGGGKYWKLVGGLTDYLRTSIVENNSAGINFTNDLTTDPVVSGVNLVGGNNYASVRSNVDNIGGGATFYFGSLPPGPGTQYPLDVQWYSDSGGSPDVNMMWDWSENRLTFDDFAGTWFDDGNPSTYGGTVAAPLYTVASNIAGSLEMATGGAADGTLQIGLNAVNTKITTNFGDVTAAGIQIVPSDAASTQIKYMTQLPTEDIFIPASQFFAGSGAPAITKVGNQYGYLLTEASADDSVVTMWEPPKWMDHTADVTAQAIFSCAGAGNINLNVKTKSIVPGTTLATDALVGATVTATGIVTADKIYKSANITILKAAFADLTTTPTSIEVSRDGVADASSSDCNFYGLHMDIVRKYVD